MKKCQEKLVQMFYPPWSDRKTKKMSSPNTDLLWQNRWISKKIRQDFLMKEKINEKDISN